MVGPHLVLVACSESESRRMLYGILTDFGLQPVHTATVREAREILARQPVQMVFCESSLPDGTFREILSSTPVVESRIPVVVASRVGDTSEYLEAMRMGAFDFVAGPYRRAELEWIVSHARRQLSAAAA